MAFEYGAIILEHYGPLIRIGKEGKWVEFIQDDDPPLKREDIIELIEQMDKTRTQ